MTSFQDLTRHGVGVVQACVGAFDFQCEHCGAMLLKSERGCAKICCSNGKVKLPLYDIPEEPAAEPTEARGGDADDALAADAAGNGAGAPGADAPGAGAPGAEEARGGRVDAPAPANSLRERVVAARRILSRLIGETVYDKLFRKHLRRFNNSLAPASQSVRRHAQPAGRGPPTFVVQGMVYHNIGPLEADDDVEALNAQMYFVDTSGDPDAATTVRINNQRFAGVRGEQERQMIAQILRELHADLTICNPYVRDMRSIYNMSAEEVGERTFVIEPESRPSDEHARRYNRPVGMNEIAVLVGDKPASRDIVVRMRGGAIRKIPDTHRAFLPLHYVLFDPLGRHGWDYTMLQNEVDGTGNRLTGRQFFAFHAHARPGQARQEILLRGGDLFREFLCCGWAVAENQNLQWLKHNQKTIRADLYQNVVDHVDNGDADARALGRRVVLPATFMGGGRYEMERFQDCLGLTRTYGKPSLFITVTCNPKWPEITGVSLKELQVVMTSSGFVSHQHYCDFVFLSKT